MSKVGDYQDPKWLKRFVWIAGAILSLFMLWLLAGCTTTKYVPVEKVRTEYVTKKDTLIKIDSIFCHDSVYIHSKGDTVWYEKWHTRYQDRIMYECKTDTFIKCDSIQVPYPVEKKLTKWEKTKIDWGGEAIVVLIVVFIIAVWLIVKRRLRR